MSGLDVYRVRRGLYEDYKEAAKRLKDHYYKDLFVDPKQLFTRVANYPIVEDLEAADIEHRFRDYLPYLIFYKEVPLPNIRDREYDRLVDYIGMLFDEHLELVEDEDYTMFFECTPSEWGKSSQKARSVKLKPLIDYFARDEFEAFVRDLEWSKCLKYYDLSETRYNKGERPDKLCEDLAGIWDIVQSAPIIF